MKKIMAVMVLAVMGWVYGVLATPAGTRFDINLSRLNCDIYSFNGYSGDFSEGGINLSVHVTQEGNRLFAFGDFNGKMYGYTLNGNYTVKGTVSTHQDRVRLRLSVALRGTYTDGVDRGRISASGTSDVSLNRLNGYMEGTLRGRVSATGFGSESFYDVISMEVPAGYGVGETDLEIWVDGDRRLVGTGTLGLPDGEEVDLVATAGFNNRRLQYRIQLRSNRNDAFARGSRLTIIITDDLITSVSGTVLGQRVSYDTAVMNYDGTYSGTFSDKYDYGTWRFEVDNGELYGVYDGLYGSHWIAGRVQRNGSFTFHTDSGETGTGRINVRSGAVSGRYRNPYENISGRFAGQRD